MCDKKTSLIIPQDFRGSGTHLGQVSVFGSSVESQHFQAFHVQRTCAACGKASALEVLGTHSVLEQVLEAELLTAK